MIKRYRMVIEGFDCRYRNLEDCGIFMSDLVEILQTKKILFGQVEILKDMIQGCSDKAKPGISMFVIYLESGSQLHTWPEEEFVALDVFSCKNFRSDDIVFHFKNFFNPMRFETKFL